LFGFSTAKLKKIVWLLSEEIVTPLNLKRKEVFNVLRHINVTAKDNPSNNNSFLSSRLSFAVGFSQRTQTRKERMGFSPEKTVNRNSLNFLCHIHVTEKNSSLNNNPIS
jgi:hypothetical protein